MEKKNKKQQKKKERIIFHGTFLVYRKYKSRKRICESKKKYSTQLKRGKTKFHIPFDWIFFLVVILYPNTHTDKDIFGSKNLENRIKKSETNANNNNNKSEKSTICVCVYFLYWQKNV